MLHIAERESIANLDSNQFRQPGLNPNQRNEDHGTAKSTAGYDPRDLDSFAVATADNRPVDDHRYLESIA